MSWAIGAWRSGESRRCAGLPQTATRLTRQPFPGRRVGGVDHGVPDGETVVLDVLDVSQLQALLRKSFNIGIDPDPRKPRTQCRAAEAGHGR